MAQLRMKSSGTRLHPGEEEDSAPMHVCIFLEEFHLTDYRPSFYIQTLYVYVCMSILLLTLC